jgi:DNA-binding response OmpR family regulator
VARLRALLRRAERSAEHELETLTAGQLRLDLGGRRAFLGGEEVHLTPIEFELVRRLATRPGVVFTREQLLNDVWGYDDGLGVRTVDSHVGALRRKLGPDILRTVHGVGYALEVGRS